MKLNVDFNNVFVDDTLDLIYFTHNSIIYYFNYANNYICPLKYSSTVSQCQYVVNDYYVIDNGTLERINELVMINGKSIDIPIMKFVTCDNCIILLTMSGQILYTTYEIEYIDDYKKPNYFDSWIEFDFDLDNELANIIDILLIDKVFYVLTDDKSLYKFNVKIKLPFIKFKWMSTNTSITHNSICFDILQYNYSGETDKLVSSVFAITNWNPSTRGLEVSTQSPIILIQSVFNIISNGSIFKNTGICCFYINNKLIVMSLKDNPIKHDSLIKITNYSINPIGHVNIYTSNTFIRIKNSNSQQLIQIHDLIYIITSNGLVELNFDDSYLNFSDIFCSEYNVYTSPDAVSITLDIVYDRPIIDQLMPIITSTIRLNPRINYLYDYVDNEHTVRSYGVGVSRQIEQLIQSELDAILADPSSLDKYDCFAIGIFLYWANCYKTIKLKNINGYIFLEILNALNKPITEQDLLHLIDTLKSSSDSELFRQQYKSFVVDPTLLLEIDYIDEIKTPYDYLVYIVTAGVEQNMRQSYQWIAQGYSYVQKLNPMYKLIKHFGSIYHVDKLLLVDMYIKTAFVFKCSDKISGDIFKQFVKDFNEQYNLLTDDKKLIVLNNITGGYSPDSSDPIIILSSKRLCGKVVPDYSISTCFTKLYFYAEPTCENIKYMLAILACSDTYIVDQ